VLTVAVTARQVEFDGPATATTAATAKAKSQPERPRWSAGRLAVVGFLTELCGMLAALLLAHLGLVMAFRRDRGRAGPPRSGLAASATDALAKWRSNRFAKL
jgi:hypothetical protein